MPTRSSSSRVLAQAWALEMSWWARIASWSCQPTVYTGFRLVMGSWKIMAICLPLILVCSLSVSLSRLRPGKLAHDRQGGHALAGARLADDPQHLPRLEGVADAPHGMDDAVVCGEVDSQVLDLEHRHGGHQARTLVWVGSKASRSPSPMKFTVSAMITMNRPGNQNSHGRVVAAC